MPHWNTRRNVAQYGGANPGAVWTGERYRRSGLSADAARAIAESDPAVDFYFFCRDGMDLSNYGKGTFQPGDAVFFSGRPWYGSAPQCDAYVRERLPRNITWVQDMPPVLTPRHLDDLENSGYTHFYVCFFHLDPGPKLVYNGPNDPANFASLWERYRNMRQGPQAKTLLASVGGWGSGTWNAARGAEQAGADAIARFIEDNEFDGIDLNFEGPSSLRFDPTMLAVVAKLAVNLRAALPDKIVTLTPMGDNVHDQLNAVDGVVGPSKNWRDILSWVNVQFYVYSNGWGVPDRDAAASYRTLVASGVPADRMTAGFPLTEPQPNAITEQQAAQFNVGQRTKTVGEVQNIVRDSPTCAGVFAWRYEATYYPSSLTWDAGMNAALRPPA